MGEVSWWNGSYTTTGGTGTALAQEGQTTDAAVILKEHFFISAG